MAIELQQTFQVQAPVKTVMDFLLDPQNVVACMPGASLTEIVDDKSFVGTVKIKVGAVTAQYQGTITYTEVDRAAGLVRMLAEGKERGGGTVRGTIVSQLTGIDGGAATSVETTSSIDLTGKIAQVGRGMIEGVSGQIIKMYVNNVRAMLEPAAAAAAAAASSDAAPAGSGQSPVPPVRQESINIVAVVLKAIGERLGNFFKRLFGRA
ncbi:carbon monoxide dehydrogenase subunit G [Steroidobacter denitrificans]|uniref:Carbon monoxide dehydrogenase subunit G n=1 Tax=Steroidobacter denitrificans TaxID=465721 RepID=A0A127F7R8_STEDE|nr:SRPBCC family protein [Steroidobacter denitrificans]AMN45589.1 carbon monoxide dehydrogenase subunit G [Steroidobacter denitrificans]